MKSDGEPPMSDPVSPWPAEGFHREDMEKVTKTGRVESFGQLALVVRVAYARFVEIAQEQKLGGDRAGVVWFRGETRGYPSLVPKIDRQCGRGHEKSLLQHFRMQALCRRAACPSDGEYSRWLCLAQHHGLPTRLLDWTESLFTAAYFAVAHEPCEEDAVVWALSPVLLNLHFAEEGFLFILDGLDGISLVKGAFAGQPYVPPVGSALQKISGKVNLNEAVLAAKAPEVDMSMMVQHAAFTIHAGSTPLQAVGLKAGFLQRFTISHGYRAALMRELAVAGLHRASVFPDLGNLAHFLTDACSR